MFFSKIDEAEPDPIFGLIDSFQADPRSNKVNLMVGVYHDEQLRTQIFESARRAKEQIFGQDLVANYLPIDGFQEMIELLAFILFSETFWEKEKNRIYAAHTTGGTGALRAGSEFLKRFVSKTISIPNFTWANHRLIFTKVGLQLNAYPYYSREKKGFDLTAMLDHLLGLPEKTIVLLHACCHNPTGCDPNSSEWKEISRVIREKRLFPFFDCAYQGLGEGLEKDVAALRFFLEEGHEMLIAYSCSKNFSMYSQRVGALFATCESAVAKQCVASQIKQIIRAMYSNPPTHGAKIVFEILKDGKLREMWLKDLEKLRHRLNMMRETLIQRLIAKTKSNAFEHLKQHKGMFSFTSLSRDATQTLIDKHGIYLTGNGRINVSGLTNKNIDYVVNGLVDIEYP